MADAKANSESRQSDKHREGVVPLWKANLRESRLCNSRTYNNLRKKLKGADLDLIEYNASENKMWCSACPCFVRDDNLVDHVATDKHLQASKIATDSNLHQSSLVAAISIFFPQNLISSVVSLFVPSLHP